MTELEELFKQWLDLQPLNEENLCLSLTIIQITLKAIH